MPDHPVNNDKDNRVHDPHDPIIIVGAGVFGLSTALALVRRHKQHRHHHDAASTFASAPSIILLDSSPSLPNPHGSSVDSSRIVRSDYADPVYSALAREAMTWWRDGSDGGWGGGERYRQSGFVLMADEDEGGSENEDKGGERGRGGGEHGKRYVQSVLRNVRRPGGDEGGGRKKLTVYDDGEEEDGHRSGLQVLEDAAAVRKVMGLTTSGPVSGRAGYVNWASGWADAEASMRFALEELRRFDVEGRVTIMTGSQVCRLIFAPQTATGDTKPRCAGLELEDGQVLRATLVILATGAWTPTLVDLRAQAVATGQVLAYMDLDESEQSAMGDKPVLINHSRGMFVIPPRNRELKVARHGYGYRNPTMIPKPSFAASEHQAHHLARSSSSEDMIEVSVPQSGVAVPAEGQRACRDMLRDLFSDPAISERPFSRTRICWYCDTRDGHFLIDWHPDCSQLFLATGGSGHGFKFLPIIGDKILDAIEGVLAAELTEKWKWRLDEQKILETTEDKSRGGRKGMILSEEANVMSC